MTSEEERALKDLTTVWLSASFPKKWRPRSMRRKAFRSNSAATVKVDEKMLVGEFKTIRTNRHAATT